MKFTFNSSPPHTTSTAPGRRARQNSGKVILQALVFGVTAIAISQAALLSTQAQTTPALTIQTQPAKAVVVTPKLATAKAFQPLLGNYVGDIFPVDMDRPDSEYRKINLVIEGIQDGKVTGHSFIRGHKQSFSGSLTPLEDGHFNVIAKEQAGTFNLVLNAKAVLGKWQPQQPDSQTQPHKLELKHKNFTYDPNIELETAPEPYGPVKYDETGDNLKQEGISEDAGKYNASKVRLTSAMVENMYRSDLEVMRNTIYARHGFAFKDPAMLSFFEYFDWYIPVSQDVSAELTPLEKDNIALIQRYEQHASKYYDHFGR